jgi:hypothetical protein
MLLRGLGAQEGFVSMLVTTRLHVLVLFMAHMDCQLPSSMSIVPTGVCYRADIVRAGGPGGDRVCRYCCLWFFICWDCLSVLGAISAV